MKKAIALIVLLVLAIVPTALANNTDESTNTNNTDDDEKMKSTPANASADEQLSPKDRMKERMKNGGAMVETRAVVKDTRAMKVETRAAVKAERAELRALGDELKACRAKRDDACDKKRADAKVEVKASLVKAADEVLELLEKSKARVSESDLSAKAEIIAELDAQIKAVTEAKAKAEALTETSTREDIKAASAALRTAINDARHALQIGTHILVATRFGGALKLLEQLETRLNNALADMKEKGVDTSSIDLTKFSAQLDLAQASHNEAADLYVKAKTSKDRKLMQQATEKMREAHAALKAAQQELRAILKELKELRSGSESLASASAETTATATTDGASVTASAEATASADAQ